jgi:hypothetical protein
MKTITLSLAAACLLPGTLSAVSYSEAMDRLGATQPEFVFHADLQNDFETAGAFLSEAYMAYLMSSPDMPPVPVDFKRLFQHFGLSGLTSVTILSEPREAGGFANHSLFTFADKPAGLFLLYGESNQPFAILADAPADADLVAEMQFNGLGLYNIIRNVVIDIMGPMGQGLIDGQMNQPVMPEGPTLAEIINRLTTRVQIVLKPDEAGGNAAMPMAMLNGKSIIRIDNVADLVQSFAPLLQQAGFSPVEDPAGPSWRMAIPNPAMPMTVHLQPLADTNDLIVSFNESSRAWFTSPDNRGLAANPDFNAVAQGLPGTGVALWYTSKRMADLQIESLDAQLPANPQLTPLIQTLKNLLKRYGGDAAGVSVLSDDAVHMIANQPASYKTNLALAGAVVPISMVSAFAPQIEKMMQGGADPEAEQASPEDDPGEE